eukprot:1988804-Rhodomonas_salina.2
MQCLLLTWVYERAPRAVCNAQYYQSQGVMLCAYEGAMRCPVLMYAYEHISRNGSDDERPQQQCQVPTSLFSRYALSGTEVA